MQTELITIGLAFLEGFGLIISPCILPILPIILAASIEGSKQRPYGIILGFVLCFSVLTAFSRSLVIWFGLDLNLVRNISFSLLLLFGVIMISSYLTEKFNAFTKHLSVIGFEITDSYNQQGFGSGMLFGALVGLIWVPCAGPILAAVIVQTVLQSSTIAGFITTLAFAIGAAVPMLFIVLFGRKLVKEIKFFNRHAILLRKTLGYILLGAILFIMYGNSLLAAVSQPATNARSTRSELRNGLYMPYSAPDFKGIAAWINSEPLQIEQLKGKVVLIDFWAYSCINCIRTLPYVIDWYNKYHEQGLIIVGVHSPEFDFERDLSNVKHAVIQDGIKYPVALDNQFSTWSSYKNQYWPAHYLIDQHGKVVYEHFGEGEYATTENNIRYLLGKNPIVPLVAEGKNNIAAQTGETYLGYSRATSFANNAGKQDLSFNYTYPSVLAINSWALNGAWSIDAEKIVNNSRNSAIKIYFSAKTVFAVMGISAPNKRIKIKILYNGIPRDGVLEVTGHTLYKLIDLTAPASGTLELIPTDPGVEIYTFTFGD